MKVLIADKFPDSGITALLEAGCKVSSNAELKDDALKQALLDHGPEVLIVRSTKVTEEMLATGSLALVVRAGAGVNTIDVAAASRLGIFVANCPGKNAIAVAELTFGLILALDRRIPDQVADLRAGRWNKKEYSKAAGLRGRTLGLVGLGSIGRAVAARAQAFEMNVLAWSRSLTDETAEELGIARAPRLHDVARDADIVSIHLAQTDDTLRLIDRKFFEAMKPRAMFLNTSRGGIVDQAALGWAMKELGIRAGLDVYANEPAATDHEFTDPFVKETALYGTHHIGASTDEAQAAIADETVRIVRAYRENGKVLHCVNLESHSPARSLLTVRHRDRVGVLAHVLAEIRKAQINVQEMENVVFAGAEAACARLRLDRVPDQALLDRIASGNDDILAISFTGLEN